MKGKVSPCRAQALLVGILVVWDSTPKAETWMLPTEPCGLAEPGCKHLGHDGELAMAQDAIIIPI